jgi:hypothetical protein
MKARQQTQWQIAASAPGETPDSQESVYEIPQ